MSAQQRPVVLDQPFQRFPREIKPVEIGISMFELGHDPERLCIMVEPAERLHAIVERFLARMAKGCVAKIVDKRYRLGQIFIEPQCARQRTRNLGDLYRMRKPRAVMIAFMSDKNLRLMFQTTKCCGMDDTVAVALEWRAGRAFRLWHQTTTAPCRITGIGRAFAITEAYSFQRHCDASFTVI